MPDAPSRKKTPYKIQQALSFYLSAYGRHTSLSIEYEDLLRYTNSTALLDANGEDTLWETVYYSPQDMQEITQALKQIYALLKTDGNINVLDHLTVARIDFCTFGNTQPFRVRIINRLNDNYDHFYVKRADASRVYGLELEYILSPERLVYLVDGNTLIEEHVAGIPGDDFVGNYLKTEDEFNQIRIAKEFVKFNERCFVRLLGDMRAYNYVVDVTPDIEGSQFRIRAIDFDQQSYDGRKSFYLPKYFKENNPIIFLGIKHMSPETMFQYQLEERSMIAARIKAEKRRFEDLIEVMQHDRISTPTKIQQLRTELAEHHNTKSFDSCESMGDVVYQNIDLIFQKEFRQSSGG